MKYTIAIAIFGSIPSLANANANLRGKVDDDGNADRVLIDVAGGQARGPPEYVPGQLLVKFKPGASKAKRAQAMAAARGAPVEKIHTPAMRDSRDEEGVTVIKTGLGVPEAIAAMIASGEVEYAEANFIYTHQAISNENYVTGGSLWGMYSSTETGGGRANKFGIGATTAWQNDKTNCSSVYVGIIDEGYNWAHQDLAANAGMNPGEIAGNKIDDDGNGYIDDVYGWDFVRNDKTVYDGSIDDHGTHVAGTIGAVGGNGVGVAGVCWNVKLMNAKFLGRSGGSTKNAIKAVDYFTNLKNKGLNVVATNNSWGGGGYSQGLKDAIDRAGAAGILFVAAAGNSARNNDSTSSYPASFTSANIISVASIDSSGALSSFSNYGPTTVDIGAPGGNILSTLPGNTYGAYSGTSMATPHVAGAVALYAALNPSASAAQIKEAILNGATPTTSLNGKVLTGGRLNVAGF